MKQEYKSSYLLRKTAADLCRRLEAAKKGQRWYLDGICDTLAWVIPQGAWNAYNKAQEETRLFVGAKWPLDPIDKAMEYVDPFRKKGTPSYGYWFGDPSFDCEDNGFAYTNHRIIICLMAADIAEDAGD